MEKFDVIVIGSGSGLEIASFATKKGLKAAIIEEGPLGGTCLNRGCIPSKMLIHAADVAETIRGSSKFGISAEIKSIDFESLVRRVSAEVDEDSKNIEDTIKKSKLATLYKSRGEFVGPKTLKVAGETIEGEKIFIVAGTRPFVPPIKGIEKIKVLTSTEALRLEKKPDHIVIVGGGYISCELAHFFGGIGVNTTLLVRGEALLENEDVEVSKFFTEAFSSKYNVRFKTEIEEVDSVNGGITIKLKDSDEVLQCDNLLMATGRIPNTDILKVKDAGIEMDEKGYIKVNEYLETNVEGVFALGDIVGILPFKHTANHQANYAIRNAYFDGKVPVDYFAIPHAVFSSPQVAGVGSTEQELKSKGVNYRVGSYRYRNTGMGASILEDGFVKVLIDDSSRILGCHIVGSDASTLIHEVVVAMKATGDIHPITHAVHVHPALSEVVQRAFFSLE